VCPFGVTQGHVFPQRRVEHVGDEPGKVALFRQVAELLDAKVEIMVLLFHGKERSKKKEGKLR